MRYFRTTNKSGEYWWILKELTPDTKVVLINISKGASGVIGQKEAPISVWKDYKYTVTEITEDEAFLECI